MDLDQAKFLDSPSATWPRVGMMICFAVAAGILMVSIWMPSTAKAFGPTSVLQRGSVS
jgi:hypothetical protein